MLKYHIKTIEVPSGGTTSIFFDSIPNTYDDLLLVFSCRASLGTGFFFDDLGLQINGDTGSNYFNTLVRAREGSIQAGSNSGTSVTLYGSPVVSSTANTFGNGRLYIPDYKSSKVKTMIADGASENNSSNGIQAGIIASTWSNTSIVRSLRILSLNNWGFAQHSSASLYGIRRGKDGVVNNPASGGIITTSGGYTIHTFNSSGVFVANRDLEVEYLVVAGGGGGGSSGANYCGGGGAGGYRSSVIGEVTGGGGSPEPRVSVIKGNQYPVIVGAGGSATVSGNDSSIFQILSIGGGAGRGDTYASKGFTGGSGGGGTPVSGSGGDRVTPIQGNIGGIASSANQGGSDSGAGSGGGAGGQGNNTVPPGAFRNDGAAGGAGLQSSITGTPSFYAAGGAGSGFYWVDRTNGIGGGANGVFAPSPPPSNAGTTNTGSGGGGGRSTAGGPGGSGVVIIRYLTPLTT
jgi:hypothetical protein